MRKLVSPPWNLVVSDRVVRTIQRCSNKVYPLETMGALYRSEYVDEVSVCLCVPPGKNSTHELNTTYVDEDFWDRWTKRLCDKGFVYVGPWHTHPGQKKPLPSDWDLNGHLEYGGYGWCRWDQKEFGGNGHFQLIAGDLCMRMWYVRPDSIELIWENDIGIKR